MSGLFVDDDTLNWYQQQFYGVRPPAPPAPPAITPEHIQLQRPAMPRPAPQQAPEPYWSPRAQWYQQQFHGVRPPAPPQPPQITPEHIQLQRPNFGPRPPAPAMPQMPRLPVTPSYQDGKVGSGGYVNQQPKAPMMPPSPQMQQPPEIQPEHIELQRPRMYRPGDIKPPKLADPRSYEVIQQMAEEYNLNPDFLHAIMSIESSGNPGAVTGSYRGLFQLSQREGRGDLLDPFNNGKEAGKVFVAQIRAFRAKHGRDPTPGEIYLIHQQGPGGAAAHVGNPDRPAWENMYSTGEGQKKGPEWAKRAIWGNVPSDMRHRWPGGVETITSREFIEIWEEKVRRRGGYGPKGTGGVWRNGNSESAPPYFPQGGGVGGSGPAPTKRTAAPGPRFIESPNEPTAGPQPPARPPARKPYFPQGGGMGGSGPPVERRPAPPQYDPSLPTPLNIPGPDPDRPESLTKPYHWDRTAARDRPEFQGMSIGPRAGRAGLSGTSAMMKKMHEDFPGVTFTSINDDYHRLKQKKNKDGSESPFFSEHNKHRAGLGLDLGVPSGVKPRDFISRMEKHLVELGFKPGVDFWFNNEYENDSNGKTGPHIHFQWQNQEAANRYAKARGVPDPVMGVRSDEPAMAEAAPGQRQVTPTRPVQASSFPQGSSRPQPTEEDLQWVEQNPQDIPKFEKQFGPLKQYFQTEEVPDSRPMETTGEMVGGTAASFLDSLLLGAGDEVIPAIMSVLPGRGNYEQEQKHYRNTETRMQNHPWLDIPARIAGGVVAPIGLGGRAAKALISNPFVKPGAIRQAAKLAGTGAAVGGTVGFNEGEGGFSNRLANVPGNAAAGAVLAPVIGTGIGSARNLYRAIRPPKVPDPVAARIADAVIGDVNAAGGAAPQAGKSLLSQAGPRTTRVADDIASGGGGEVAVKLAKAIMSTGMKPTGSNLIRWVWTWFKANKEKLTPEQQKEVAELLMNPKKLDEAMNRVMNHREWELGRIAGDARVDNTAGGTMVGVATARDKNRRKVQGR